MTPGSLDPNSHFETIARTARDGIVTVSADATIRYANPAVETIFGYEADELVDRSLEVLFPAGEADDVVRSLSSTGRPEDDPGRDDVRLRGRRRNGDEVPLSVSFSAFELAGDRYVAGIVRDVTDRQRREERLAALNDLAQALTAADSTGEVCERTIEAAETTLDRPVAAVELYDSETGRLEPCSWTEVVDEIADDGALFADERSIAWDAFVVQEGSVVDDLLGETDLEPSSTPLRSAIVQPLGSYGVFVAGATEADAFDEDDVDTTSLLVGILHSALERVDREQALRERKEELEAKSQSLDRVRRINDAIRELTTALTRSTGRTEIASEVCTRLAAAEPYRFAWFGSVDSGHDEVTAEAWAGTGDGFLEAVAADDGSIDHGPTDRAVRTRTPQIDNDVYQDPPFEPWRREAIRRDYRSAIAIPVVYQDTLYGVLHLYAVEPDVFRQMEVVVLQELGETIGYALNADERRQAFTSERSVDLAFEVGGGDDPILEMAAETGARFQLENLVERRDGSATGFFTVRDRDSDTVVEYATDRGLDLQLLTDRDEACLFECSLDEPTVWAQLLQRGSIVRDATVTPTSARLEIRIPRSADPRSYDSLLAERLGEVELLARREHEEPVMTPEEFEDAFRDRLTERQDEVLQTAYYAGYFEWPRETKSGELAEILGIAQPTVSRHLRAGEEEFLSMVYEES